MSNRIVRSAAAVPVALAAAVAVGSGSWVRGGVQRPGGSPPRPADQPEKTTRPRAVSNDKKLIALHNEFIKKAEKLATEFEHGKQPDKAVLVYEQILKLVPDYDKAQQQLDRLKQRKANSGHKSFEVLANKDWQDTGVRVIAGKPLKLAATGEWTFNMSHQLGPEGMEIPKVLKDFKLGSLIGMIPDPDAKTQKPFYIGPAKEFVADQSGPLLVRMHDTDPSDNRGSLTLEIVGRFDTK